MKTEATLDEIAMVEDAFLYLRETCKSTPTASDVRQDVLLTYGTAVDLGVVEQVVKLLSR
jgi:hypothetical protein